MNVQAELDSSDLSTYDERRKIIEELLRRENVPPALARSWSGDAMIERWVMTRKTTSLALLIPALPLSSRTAEQMVRNIAGTIKTLHIDEEAMQEAWPAKPQKPKAPPTRAERREQDRQIAKFLRSLKEK